MRSGLKATLMPHDRSREHGDDVSGEPIDWMSHAHADDGFRDGGGLLINTSLDCPTGPIRIHVGPFHTALPQDLG